MSFRRPSTTDEPFAWWGPVWSEPTRFSLSDLIRDDILTAEGAAFLSLLVKHRASMVVAAGPSGAGKTTLLTALADQLPASARKIYVRGSYEPFDFFSTSEARSSTLMVNEISPHLPIYLWGPGVRRVLQGVMQGYQLLATAHAESVDEFVYGLAGYPLRIPVEEIAQIDLLVLLDAWRDETGVRRGVRSIVSLSAADKGVGLSPITIANRNERASPLTLDDAAARTAFELVADRDDRFDDAMSLQKDQLSSPEDRNSLVK